MGFRLEFSYASLKDRGYSRVAGVDEVGRGALAGPVVAAAVIIDDRLNLGKIRIRDSKTLSPSQRDASYNFIKENAFAIGVGIIHANDIDRMNIRQATLAAMNLAFKELEPVPELCLVDGIDKFPSEVKQMCIPKGDSLAFCIAAASIVAKVTRDRWMIASHSKYPVYGFQDHKGYGTSSHLEAIAKYGNSDIHRLSFSPCSSYL